MVEGGEGEGCFFEYWGFWFVIELCVVVRGEGWY